MTDGRTNEDRRMLGRLHALAWYQDAAAWAYQKFTKPDPARTLTEADLEGFARRVWNYARQSAEANDPAAVYCQHLFRDAVVQEALAMLKTVVQHERQQSCRPLPDWQQPKDGE
jgi:hypothetical protein